MIKVLFQLIGLLLAGVASPMAAANMATFVTPWSLVDPHNDDRLTGTLSGFAMGPTTQWLSATVVSAPSATMLGVYSISDPTADQTTTLYNAIGGPGVYASFKITGQQVTGVHFSTSMLAGVSSFAPRDFVPPIIPEGGPGPQVSSAPEPSMWVMMVIGFGAVGVGLRRERMRARPAA